ncbi:unnamed protein product [Rotaria sp. Silwood1]|nr:unnamed protein product [Rotaria sp. Silwood1]
MEDNSFKFGVHYCYAVGSIDEVGESTQSDPMSIFPRAPAPVGFIAFYTERTSKSVTLQWKPITNCKGYIIKRATDSSTNSFFVIKKIHASSVNDIQDTSVTFGTHYYYTISSVDKTGESNQSKPIGIVCHWIPVPTNLTASYIKSSSESITLHWQPIVKGKGYTIKRAITLLSSAFATIKTLHDSLISHAEDTSFICGITYYYTISTIDEGGESIQSDPVSICVRAPPPTNLSASFDNHDTCLVILRWSPISTAAGYIVKRATTSPSSLFSTLKQLDDPSTIEFQDKSILFGATYNYVITSLDKAGESGDSSIVSIHCSRAPAPKKFEIMISKDTSSTITLHWSIVSNCSGYRIYRFMANDPSIASYSITFSCNCQDKNQSQCIENDKYSKFLLATITDLTISSYTDSNVKNGIEYHYWISSVDVIGVSFGSQLVSGKTVLPAPTNLRAKVLVKRNTTVLCWTSVPTATGYRIERKNKSGHSETIGRLSGDSDTKFHDKQCVLRDMPYIYTVYAIDDTSESEPSNHVQVTSLSSEDQTDYSDLVQVRFGNLVTENVDAIVICSTSEKLVESVLTASGIKDIDVDKQRCISLPAGRLSCKSIILNPWAPNVKDAVGLENSIRQFMNTTFQYAVQAQCKTIAFPALATDELIPGWEVINDQYPMRVHLSPSSEEYRSVLRSFRATISATKTNDNIRIERIQNERLYRQYQIEKKHFYKMLQKDTQKTLYHGCPNDDAKLQSIMEQGLDRSRAGDANGKNIS